MDGESRPEPPDEPAEAGEPVPPERLRRVGRLARTLDEKPALLRASRAFRSILPGDHRYGDALSTARTTAPDRVGRQIADLNAERPSALRELGLGALQVWQALSEAQGRGRGTVEATILFTDLVGFSDWALEAGDAAAVGLLRDVAREAEPPIEDHGGRIVKRLGDGLMAVFAEPADALQAAWQAQTAIAGLEAGGYRPALRAGLHTGRPRRIGGDYLGVDVNIAARIAEASNGRDVLVSEVVRDLLADEPVDFKRVWRFKAKGAPRELRVFAATPASGR